MKVPTIQKAEELLKEAERLNPGPWIGHSRTAAFCARAIAEKCGLDGDIAYVLGLLHDIGRREGVTDMRHIIDGFRFMTSLGCDDSARICLSHSFPFKDIGSYNGVNDCTHEDTRCISAFLTDVVYDDYDRLIQLCDALSYPDGATYIEKRLVDVVMRRGFNELTVPKWKAFFEIKRYFDDLSGTDIYTLCGL